MVPYSSIVGANALAAPSNFPQTCVFMGATSGIGQLTIRAMVSIGIRTRIYIIGRSSARERMEIFISEMQAINPEANLIWLEGEVSLLAEVKRICVDLRQRESSLDLLFLSTGYVSLSGIREETSENIEITQSLECYSRFLAIQSLLPLLNKAQGGRVVSVLAAGFETTSVDFDDLQLRKPGSFGPRNARLLNATLTTLILDHYADENPNITFIHSIPGWVNTGNVRRGLVPGTARDVLVRWILEPVVNFFAFSNEESGQRNLFMATSSAFGGHGIPWEGARGTNLQGNEGPGLFLVGSKNDCILNAKVISKLRQTAIQKAWKTTSETLQPFS